MTSPEAGISELFLRVFSGVGGGLLGTCVALLMTVLLMASQGDNTLTLQGSKEFSGISLIAVIFIGSFVANLGALFFLTVLDPIKYIHRKHILRGGFFANLFLFICTIPFYLLTESQEFLLSIAGVHLFIAASSSALFAEIFSGVKYAISGVIGVSVAQMILIFTYIILGAPSGGTLVTIMFLPFIWFLLPIFIFITEKLYLFMKKEIER